MVKEHRRRFLPDAGDARQGILLPLLVVLLWQVVAVSGKVNPVLLPAPLSILAAAGEMLQSGELAAQLWVSFIRVAEGFLLAAALAFLLGGAMGLSQRVYSLLNFSLQLLRPIPPIAWIPLAILWFGIEEGSKIFIIMIGSFFPIFTNVLGGIRQTEKKFVELAKVLEAPPAKFVRCVVIPGALPYVAVGLRSGLGYAWMCVVAAELSAGMRGIGYMLTDARAMMQTDRVIVGMLTIGLVGKLLDSLLLLVEKKCLRGKELYGERD